MEWTRDPEKICPINRWNFVIDNGFPSDHLTIILNHQNEREEEENKNAKTSPRNDDEDHQRPRPSNRFKRWSKQIRVASIFDWFDHEVMTIDSDL